MQTLTEFIDSIKSKNTENYYRNIEKIYENEDERIEIINGDFDEFIEDISDDRRRVSEVVFKYVPTEEFFKVIVKINNDQCNFDVMSVEMFKVMPKTKVITIFE